MDFSRYTFQPAKYHPPFTGSTLQRGHASSPTIHLASVHGNFIITLYRVAERHREGRWCPEEGWPTVSARGAWGRGAHWSDQGRWGRTHIPTRVSNLIDLAVDAAKTSSNRGRVGGWRTVCWWRRGWSVEGGWDSGVAESGWRLKICGVPSCTGSNLFSF